MSSYRPNPLPRGGLSELANQLELELAVIAKLSSVWGASTETTVVQQVASSSGGSSSPVSPETIEDIVGALIADGDHLVWTYDDALGTLTGDVTDAALTKTDDTNVTLTLTGTPATALLEAVELQLGWTGTLADARLSTTTVVAGSYGSATRTPVYTVGATGRLTASTDVLTTPAASSITGGQALSSVDDTNVTLLLGGSPTTALLAATSLTLGWAGTLAVSRGGSGVGTLTGLLQGNGTSAFTAITNSSTVGQVLRVTGAATYAWGALDLADTDAVTGVLPLTNGGTNKALTASAGGIVWTDSDSMEVLAGTSTAGLALVSGASATPSWFTPTAGSVLFAGTAGILQQDNANFFWDDSNNRLGVGTTSPSREIQIFKTSANAGLSLRSSGGSGKNYAILSSTSGNLDIQDDSDSDPILRLSGTDASFQASATGGIRFAQYLRVGSLTAPASVTNGDITAVRISLGNITFGTSANGGIAMGSSTAPSTSPADAIQLWVADTNAVAGKAGLHGRSEDGSTFALGNETYHTQAAHTGGSPAIFTLTGGAHTTLAASTEATDVYFNLARTVQFATGNFTEQRAVRFMAPTYGFVGASTIDQASTVFISGGPVEGTNASLLATYGLYIDSDAVGSATKSYGLFVNAGSGAANNYSAALMGGGVGIATDAPTQPLHVVGNTKITGSIHQDDVVKPYDKTSGGSVTSRSVVIEIKEFDDTAPAYSFFIVHIWASTTAGGAPALLATCTIGDLTQGRRLDPTVTTAWSPETTLDTVVTASGGQIAFPITSVGTVTPANQYINVEVQGIVYSFAFSMNSAVL